MKWWAAYRKSGGATSKCIAAYLYARLPSESTNRSGFYGHAIIAENGTLLQEDRMNLTGNPAHPGYRYRASGGMTAEKSIFMAERHDYQTVIFQLHHVSSSGSGKMKRLTFAARLTQTFLSRQKTDLGAVVFRHIHHSSNRIGPTFE